MTTSHCSFIVSVRNSSCTTYLRRLDPSGVRCVVPATNVRCQFAGMQHRDSVGGSKKHSIVPRFGQKVKVCPERNSPRHRVHELQKQPVTGSPDSSFGITIVAGPGQKSDTFYRVLLLHVARFCKRDDSFPVPRRIQPLPGPSPGRLVVIATEQRLPVPSVGIPV